MADIGYKVLLRGWYPPNIGVLMSACVNTFSDLNMKYIPGIWTPKRKYGPFIFSKIDYAKDFIPPNSTFEIWECEFEGSVPYDRILRLGTISYDITYRHVKDILDNGVPTFKRDYAPTGTIITNRIKLTRRIV